MFRAKAFMCAESAAIDQRLHTLSAFHIMEEIHASSFPVAIPRLCVLLILQRDNADPAEADLKLEVVLNDQSLFNGPMPVKFLQRPKATLVANTHGLVIPGPGTLHFAVKEDERILSSWDISVDQVRLPGTQGDLFHATAEPEPK